MEKEDKDPVPGAVEARPNPGVCRARNQRKCGKFMVRGGAAGRGLRTSGYAALAFDTGAGDDIVNLDDDEVIVRRSTQKGAATIEAIGADVPVDTIATVTVPGLPGTRQALAVPHTLNCTSGGKLVMQDGHTF